MNAQSVKSVDSCDPQSLAFSTTHLALRRQTLPKHHFLDVAFSTTLASIPLIEILHAKHVRPDFSLNFLP